MRKLKIFAFFVAMVAVMTPRLFASQEGDTKAIKQVMQQQVEAWNRGDVAGFMTGYKDSGETTYIGETIQHGFSEILAQYKKTFPNKDAMGTLEFSDVDVISFDPGHAMAIGKYHLTRSAAAGGDASGYFSLLWEKPHPGAPWKILIDHSSPIKQ